MINIHWIFFVLIVATYKNSDSENILRKLCTALWGFSMFTTSELVITCKSSANVFFPQ